MLIYIAVVLPLRFAFEVSVHDGLRVWDTMVDTAFILDVCVNFFTAYTSDEGVLVTDLRKIAMHYLTGEWCRPKAEWRWQTAFVVTHYVVAAVAAGWAAVDVLSSIPDAVFYRCVGGCSRADAAITVSVQTVSCRSRRLCTAAAVAAAGCHLGRFASFLMACIS